MPHYEPPVGCLKGRAVLVTGAGDGIGRAAALAYARYGAEVILLGKTVAKLEAVYDEILGLGGPEPAVYPLDLTGASARDYRDLAGSVEAQIGHLDGILHNAAVLEMLTPLEFHPLDAWDRTMRANVTAPFLLTQACLPLLKAAPDAALIFTSDECALTPKGYWGAYGASKAALHNLALMWAQELSDGPIRVNVLEPGAVRTAMRLRTHPGAPLSSWPLSEALMPAYVYFMGPDGQNHRGQLIQAQDWIDESLDDRLGM
ncbi:MAG: YciK family oxidoreductase [Acidiferrobacter sp.]